MNGWTLTLINGQSPRRPSQKGGRSLSSGRQEFSRIHIFALLNRVNRICNFAKGKDIVQKPRQFWST